MGDEVPDRVENRLDKYGEVHEKFDRRITRNENYRLQVQGALKFAAFSIGTAIAVLGVLISLGVVVL